MEFLQSYHPHHYRNRFLLNGGGNYNGGSIVSASNFQLPDWFYKDEEGNIHSRYNFVGDYEVSAYGSGESQGGIIGGGGIIIDGKSIGEIIAGDNIYINTTEDGKAVINATGGGGDTVKGAYLPLSGGTLTGHLALGNGNTTNFLKVETIRKVNNVPNGAAFYTNSDGTAAFFHKTYQTTGLTGAVNDAILKFDHNGLFFAKGATNRTSATEFHEVLTDALAYRKTEVYTKEETNALLHNHDNKEELDLIKTGDVAKWNQTYTDLYDWFYKDEDGNIHSRYNFVGDNEVSAYGSGESQGGGSSSGGGYITVNDRNINSIKSKDHITLGGSGTELIIGDTIDLTPYLTKASGDTIYQPKGNYLTEHQDLSQYALKSELHSHSNKAVLDNLTQSVIDNSHTHTNKSVLDGISANKVKQWDSGYTYGVSAYTDLNDWFYKDSNGIVHSRYNFVGDYEVSAYGSGNSQGGTSGGGFITVNGRNINSISAGENITLGGSNTNLIINAIQPDLSSYATQKWVEDKHYITGVDLSNYATTAFTDTTYQKKGDYALKSELHSHSNKESVLDKLTVKWWEDSQNFHLGYSQNNAKWTSAYTWVNENGSNVVSAVTDFRDWFYKDKDGNIHSKYNFVGDNEVSAYGNGNSQGGGSSSGGGYITVNGRNINSLSGAGGTSISVNGTVATISSHTHTNMAVLTGITATKVSNWDKASASAHTHENKVLLDTITTAKTSNWDDAYSWIGKEGEDLISKSHTHLNMAVLTGITAQNITNWNDANSKKHTHSNKSVLDGITAEKVTSWDNTASSASTWNKTTNDVNKWFEEDANGNLHCKLNFVGNYEVSAYGNGNSQGGGSSSGGGYITVNGRNINTLNGVGGTSISVNGTTATISSHTHSNMAVISGITSDHVKTWNQASSLVNVNSDIWDTVTDKAPIDHSSTATTYGTASTSKYGHVKLSNSLTSTTQSGVALTPYAGKLLNDKITGVNTRIDNCLPLSGGTLTGDLQMTNGTSVSFNNGYSKMHYDSTNDNFVIESDSNILIKENDSGSEIKFDTNNLKIKDVGFELDDDEDFWIKQPNNAIYVQASEEIVLKTDDVRVDGNIVLNKDTNKFVVNKIHNSTIESNSDGDIYLKSPNGMIYLNAPTSDVEVNAQEMHITGNLVVDGNIISKKEIAAYSQGTSATSAEEKLNKVKADLQSVIASNTININTTMSTSQISLLLRTIIKDLM